MSIPPSSRPSSHPVAHNRVCVWRRAPPQLRELDLSSNCITWVSEDPFGGVEEPFVALETLHLGSQSPKLHPTTVFAFSALPELRTLRLPNNKIRGCAPPLVALRIHWSVESIT